LVPACTLIVGVPEETEDDLIKTIELVDDLKDIKSLIVPLYFVPMGRLKNEDWFKCEEISGLYRELLVKCLKHDVRWVYSLIDDSFAGRWYKPFITLLYKLFVRIIEYKCKKAGVPTR